MGLPPLGYLVRHVVGVRPEKEMVWIHASPIVAAMQNLHSVRNWANTEFIGNAMSTPFSVLNLEKAVPLVTYNAEPIPAILGLVYLLPKAIHEIILR
jgi:hypothetical protein